MAQDVHDFALQDSNPHSNNGTAAEKENRLLGEKLLSPERPSGQREQSRNESNDDTSSLHPFPTTSDNERILPSPSALQPIEQDYDNGGERDEQRFGFKRTRTIPAWVRSVEQEEDEPDANVTSRLLPPHPDDAIIAQHNHSPYTPSRPNYNHSEYGESLDGDIAIEIEPRRESRWQTFSRTIAYPREQGVEQELVTRSWINENHGDYSQPWRGKFEEGEDTEDPLKKKRRSEIWFKRFHNTLLESPIVPLIFRLTVWCFSLAALALGGSIQHLSEGFPHPQGPSALMAIIVDAVALIYLIYITWDEYTAKPLGLRSPSAKARLVLLDIFFIVFDSANLSLAFESLSAVRGSCTQAEVNKEIAPKNEPICERQKALASVLLIALVAWLTTFAISVLRLVKRVAPS